jgi:hypothetical protein
LCAMARKSSRNARWLYASLPTDFNDSPEESLAKNGIA